MLTHPDPQLQIILNDVTEQRDIAMVAKASLQVALAAAQAEIATLKAQVSFLTPPGAEVVTLKAVPAPPAPAPDVVDAEIIKEEPAP